MTINPAVLILALTTSACGASSNDNSAPNGTDNIHCGEACEVVNLSNDDLKSRFGTTQVPTQYQFATRFAEGAGFQAFSECLKEPGNSIRTKSCTTRALSACTQACTAAGH